MQGYLLKDCVHVMDISVTAPVLLPVGECIHLQMHIVTAADSAVSNGLSGKHMGFNCTAASSRTHRASPYPTLLLICIPVDVFFVMLT